MVLLFSSFKYFLYTIVSNSSSVLGQEIVRNNSESQLNGNMSVGITSILPNDEIDEYPSQLASNRNAVDNTKGLYHSPVLLNFIIHLNKLLEEAKDSYVSWMIAYEFPSFASLTDRMRNVGSRVGKTEMALFVRRYLG